MALIARAAFRRPLGVRSISVFGILADTFPQDWSQDEGVTHWVSLLRDDPWVLTATGAVHGTGLLFQSLLRTASNTLHAALYPITYPLAQTLPPPPTGLSPPPFTPTLPDSIATGSGELSLPRLNIWERASLSLKNVGNTIAVSRSPILRTGYRIVQSALSFPLRLMSEPSKETLVVTAVQRYFPDFNLADFAIWMEESFLPALLAPAIAGRPSEMSAVAEAAVIKERELMVADVVTSGSIVHSRLLEVYDVDVGDFEFKLTTPVITVKCVADHTQDVRARDGAQLIGGPECIRATEFLTAMTVVVVDGVPVWKAHELHNGSTYKRI